VSTILAFSDPHFPWASEDAIGAVYRGIRKYSPKIIVNLGDLYDFFSFNRFVKSQNVILPRDEIAQGRAAAEKMWKNINALAPKARKYQLRGNHDERPLHRLLQKAPELESLCNFDALFNFPGVETMREERDELIIDDIVFIHGYILEIGGHCRDMLRNVCRGHTHIGYVYMRNHFDRIIWELNVGYCADRDAEPLLYTAQKNFTRWTTGYGVIDDNGPRFIAS